MMGLVEQGQDPEMGSGMGLRTDMDIDVESKQDVRPQGPALESFGAATGGTRSGRVNKSQRTCRQRRPASPARRSNRLAAKAGRDFMEEQRREEELVKQPFIKQEPVENATGNIMGIAALDDSGVLTTETEAELK
jgi:hypothetical protein